MTETMDKYRDIQRSGHKDSVPVAPPTDDEWERIYDEFDECTVLKDGSGTDRKLHLHPPGEPEGVRVCDGASAPRPRDDYRSPAIETFPPKYLDLCSNCLFRWRRA